MPCPSLPASPTLSPALSTWHTWARGGWRRSPPLWGAKGRRRVGRQVPRSLPPGAAGVGLCPLPCPASPQHRGVLGRAAGTVSSGGLPDPRHGCALPGARCPRRRDAGVAAAPLHACCPPVWSGSCTTQLGSFRERCWGQRPPPLRLGRPRRRSALPLSARPRAMASAAPGCWHGRPWPQPGSGGEQPLARPWPGAELVWAAGADAGCWRWGVGSAPWAANCCLAGDAEGVIMGALREP